MPGQWSCSIHRFRCCCSIICQELVLVTIKRRNINPAIFVKVRNPISYIALTQPTSDFICTLVKILYFLEENNWHLGFVRTRTLATNLSTVSQVKIAFCQHLIENSDKISLIHSKAFPVQITVSCFLTHTYFPLSQLPETIYDEPLQECRMIKLQN